MHDLSLSEGASICKAPRYSNPHLPVTNIPHFQLSAPFYLPQFPYTLHRSIQIPNIARPHNILTGRARQTDRQTSKQASSCYKYILLTNSLEELGIAVEWFDRSVLRTRPLLNESHQPPTFKIFNREFHCFLSCCLPACRHESLTVVVVLLLLLLNHLAES